MAEARNLLFPDGHHVRSLVWAGDRLVDLVGGGASVCLDGSVARRSVNWAYNFDRALVSDDAATTVLYTALATKGLVIPPDQRDVREINRSYYHANAYEFPITVGRLFNGADVLIHCPDAYNRLVVETLHDGQRLASATARAGDMFQSRLRLSPDGRHLLTTGWVWHPLGVMAVYDLVRALSDTTALDKGDLLPWQAIDAEVEAACWLTSDQIVVSTNPEEEPLDGESDGALGPGELGVWSLNQRQWIARSKCGGHTGTLDAIGQNVLALFEHPRLIDPFTGRLVTDWPGLNTGTQTSSIIRHEQLVPPIAIDAANNRFAVASGHAVNIVQLPAATAKHEAQ
jgi:hypothetical protein